MSILKEVVEVTYSDIIIQSLLCVTIGLILAMVIEEFKKQDMKINGGLLCHSDSEWLEKFKKLCDDAIEHANNAGTEVESNPLKKLPGFMGTEKGG